MNARLFTILLLLLTSYVTRAQQLQVTGVVKDDTGKPLRGVTIVIRDDTTSRTTSNTQGGFSLKARTNDVLRFVLQGKQTLEQRASANPMQVTLYAWSVGPDAKKSTDPNKPTSPPSSGSANAEGSAHTTVRGNTSIYGDSKPLWVLDGVILDDNISINPENLASADAKVQIASAIGGLNAEDIASFRVLKDASATSIYGPRAVGGVIVVTTRRGSAGSSSISYTGEFTFRPIPSYRDYNLINSQGHMSMLMSMYNGGNLEIAKLATSRRGGVFGRMYDMLYKQDEQGNFKLPNTLEAKQAFLEQAERRNTNWFAELYRPSILHNHTISITAGSDRANYYASISALIDPGWAKYSNENRYTANLNANYKINSKTKLIFITNGSYRTQHTAGSLKPYTYATKTSRTLDPRETYVLNYAPFNIHKELQNNYSDIQTADFKLQGNLVWTPIKNLETSVLAAIRYQSVINDQTATEESNLAEAYRAKKTRQIQNLNTHLYKDPQDPYAQPVTVLPEGGFAELAQNTLLSKDFRATARYQEDFGSKIHRLQLFGGMEMNETSRTYKFNRDYGILYNLGRLIYMEPLAFQKLANDNKNYFTDSTTLSRNVSFFGNLSYSLRNKYTVNGTLRFDGTNKFGQSDLVRWLPTWNVAFSWDVAQEGFFRYLNPLSSLLFKVSYGITADSPYYGSSYKVIRGIIPWRPTLDSRESALSLVDPDNFDLTYEKKQELNLGLNTSLFKGRIGIGLEVYNRNNYDLIGKVGTQGTSGYLTRYGNVAEMRSNGVELSLTTKNIKTKDFSWTTTLIYAKNKNKITKLYSNSSVKDIISGTGFALQGYPVASLFSIPFNGLNSEGLPTFLGPNGEVTIDGIDFDDRSRTDYLKYEGTTVPTDIGSLSNVFTYKGFTLNLFVTYSFGNVLRLSSTFDSTYDDVEVVGREYKERWVQPGDELTKTVPTIPSAIQLRARPNISQAYRAYNYSTERVAKGDFVRMKEISLSYEFGKSLVKKLHLKRLSMKLQASNLFLFYSDSKLRGADPEYGLKGTSPLPRQVMLTLRLGF